MSVCLTSAAFAGLDCTKVNVEVDVFRGLAEFTIVGLGGKAIQEAKKRIYSAIKNSPFNYPTTRKIVNLGPANVRKQGTLYDVPIALGLLAASKQIPTTRFRDSLFLGELSLAGHLQAVPGVALLASFAKQQGYKYVFVPEANLPELSLVTGIKIIAVKHLAELVEYLKGNKPLKAAQIGPPPSRQEQPEHRSFTAIRGQAKAKRALSLVAAGGHNILMNGPPGTGKTILANSLVSILPTLRPEEQLQLIQIRSITAAVTCGVPIRRPFRLINHNCTKANLLGTNLQPGELTLAHSGVLFLDELLEFQRTTLEALRQPLETKQVKLRAYGRTVSYPADCIIVAATNPCPCGFASDPERECKCSQYQIRRYQNKLSGPLRDRFDLQVELNRVEADKLFAPESERGALQELRQQIADVRALQAQRYQELAVGLNSKITYRDIERFCPLSKAAKRTLAQAVKHYQLSTRAFVRVQKLARTIADFAGVTKIKDAALLEALQYRLGNGR